jgi:predicted alpha/beta superfamily hydrolase
VLGEERAFFVRTPPGYAQGAERFPVLYVTDAHTQFAHTVTTVEFLARNGRMPEMIVVGVTNTDRTRDLTPSRIVAPPGEGGAQFPTSGGADAFLKFFETELIPFVEGRYRTHPYRVFAGHSFGGLFAVHAFASKPELFNAYIAVSPALDWDDALAIRKAEELFRRRKDLDRSLYFTLGHEPGPITDGFNRFKKLLEKQRPAGLEWAAAHLEDEDHGSIVLRSHYLGLRHVFAAWQLPRDPTTGNVVGGLREIEEHYAKLTKKYGFDVPPPEPLMNALGYQLLAAGRTDDAITAFKRNAERYPGSANVHDSLAEAYERTGRPELAKAGYEAAVKIGSATQDPNLELFKANLARVAAIVDKK